MAATKKTNDVDIIIGLRLRELRTQFGKTQEEIALLLQIKAQQLQKYEKAIDRISASRLFNFASLFGVDIQTFFDGIPQREPLAGFSEAPARFVPREGSLSGQMTGVLRMLLDCDPPEKRLETIEALRKLSNK